MDKNSTSFLVICKLMKTLKAVFLCLFKQLTFGRLFSLNFSSKSPWCSPVPLKFESYNLHHCKKNCHKLAFLVFTEQLLYQIVFGRLHCYEVLVKKCNKPLLQKSEKKFLDQERFVKNLLKVNEKNNAGISRINQIMSKLLTLSKCLQLNCQQIQLLFPLLHYFEHAEHFHISHFTNNLRHFIIIDHK